MSAEIINIRGDKMGTNDQQTERRVSLAESLAKLLEQANKNAADLTAMRDEVGEMRELLTAWRNARGAIRIIQVISATLKWCAMLGGSVALIWYSIKHGEWKL